MKSHEIIIPPIDEKAQELFNGDRLKLMVDSIEKQLEQLSLDPTDPSDYKKFGSIKRQLGSFFAAVDRAGKSIVDPLNKVIKETNSQRKTIKDRGTDIKNAFMLVRDQYDAEVAAYNKAIADLEDLLRRGHLKLAEFRKPTLEEWKSFLTQIEDAEISEALQGDRYEEFKKLKAESIDLNARRFVEFEETEKALEAGRIALKEKEDAEAAARHAQRQAEQQAKEAPKPAPTTADEALSAAKNSVYGQLMNSGMPKDKARLFVLAVEAGQIKNLKLDL
jgi:tetratricopeptide (TPR) repeat protein